MNEARLEAVPIIDSWRGEIVNTLFLLMAQYNGLAVIPLDRVCFDYMNLSVEKFKRKRLDGEIDIAVVRLGGRQPEGWPWNSS